MKAGSNLEKILSGGGFAVTGELGPPKGCDLSVVERKAGLLKGNVDSINVTDNQTAIVRMSSIAVSAILVRMGLEPNMQMVCRDRNRIAMQSDIFGAYALGIRNMLCLSGDHQKFGNQPTAKNVFDLDSIQLIQTVKQMRDEHKVLGGDDIEGPPQMFIGAAANPFADPFEFRVIRLAKKAAAGADFIQTQCIYDMKKFEKFMEMARDRGLDKRVHILAGVTPLKSVGMARYMKEKVAG
ncbi:MAG TPA: methylenetetrahydrofolate reductase, partial [Thermodesulfobacteriota bacterium]|nr:methylenetetrahydrofolate reductase [Thermodesulfobacteriota bacterium]